MFPWKARDLFVDNIKEGRKKKNVWYIWNALSGFDKITSLQNEELFS